MISMQKMGLCALVTVFCLSLFACGGTKPGDAQNSTATESAGQPEATAAVTPEAPKNEAEAEEMEAFEDALDVGSFPFTVSLGAGWYVRASDAGSVIATQDNGLTLAIQTTIYGANGVNTVEALKKAVAESDVDATEVKEGQVGGFEALTYKTTEMAEEGAPPSRVAYVVVDESKVISITVGAVAFEDGSGPSEADIDAAFVLACSTFRLK